MRGFVTATGGQLSPHAVVTVAASVRTSDAARRRSRPGSGTRVGLTTSCTSVPKSGIEYHQRGYTKGQHLPRLPMPFSSDLGPRTSGLSTARGTR